MSERDRDRDAVSVVDEQLTVQGLLSASAYMSALLACQQLSTVNISTRETAFNAYLLAMSDWLKQLKVQKLINNYNLSYLEANTLRFVSQVACLSAFVFVHSYLVIFIRSYAGSLFQFLILFFHLFFHLL